MPKRRFLFGVLVGAGSFAGTLVYRRRTDRNRTRVDLYFDDGSMVSLAQGNPDADGCSRSPARRLPRRGDRAGSRGTRRRLVERAYLTATSCSARAGAAPTTWTSTDSRLTRCCSTAWAA